MTFKTEIAFFVGQGDVAAAKLIEWLGYDLYTIYLVAVADQLCCLPQWAAPFESRARILHPPQQLTGLLTLQAFKDTQYSIQGLVSTKVSNSVVQHSILSLCLLLLVLNFNVQHLWGMTLWCCIQHDSCICTCSEWFIYFWGQSCCRSFLFWVAL